MPLVIFMFSLTTKRKVRAWGYSRLSLIFVLILVLLMVSSVWDMYRKYSESRDMLLDSRERMGALVVEKDEVEAVVEYLESDLGREAEIRRRFRTGREGERMVVIVEDEAAESEEEEEEPGGFWSSFKSWISGSSD